MGGLGPFFYIRMGQPVHAGVRQPDSATLLSGGLRGRSAQVRAIADLYLGTHTSSVIVIPVPVNVPTVSSVWKPVEFT